MAITSTRDAHFTVTNPVSTLYYPPKVLELITVTFHRVAGMNSAELLWNRLSRADQRILGTSLEDAKSKHRGGIAMWQALHQVSRVQAIIDIALALGHLGLQDRDYLASHLCSSDVETTIESAVKAGHFVILQRPPKVYWQTQEIELDWQKSKATWTYIWELGRSAKVGAILDREIFGEFIQRDYLTKQKSRLGTLLGEEWCKLLDLIVPAGGGSQEFTLDRNSIRLFETDGTGELREYLG